ncbi:MAG: FecR family protein, partial [Verrucomicrobiia bacterium]
MFSPKSFCLSSILPTKMFLCGFNYLSLFFLTQFLVNDLEAVDASVIVASVEGEVFSISIEDEFQVTLDSSSVGKKIEEKSILLTGKSGSASLLFSNGALITIKPGSRFYLRKFAQKSFTSDHNAKPSEIEEEPSQSELLAHLDFGNLIVKAPKLRKGSSMVLSSPLGTAGIRGTMFQLVAVRNPVTGDITGGVNLISGDISFTDVGGNEVTLVSGQSLQLASGKLGESMATMPGGLVNLTATYGAALTGGEMPPSIDMLFPGVTGTESEGESSALFSSATNEAMDTDWEMVHEIASEIFFTIESSETSSSSFSFDDVSDAVTISTPTPQPAT